jgi:putative SOS response-associated peptidase YedK
MEIKPNWRLPIWLGGEAAEPDHLRALLAPDPAEDMRMRPVDRRVGNVRNDDPSLIEPVPA